MLVSVHVFIPQMAYGALSRLTNFSVQSLLCEMHSQEPLQPPTEPVVGAPRFPHLFEPMSLTYVDTLSSWP